MRKINAIGILLFTLLLIIGCGKDSISSEPKEVDYKLLATEKSLPSEVQDFVFTRTESPAFSYWMKKVSNQSDYEAAWKIYELEDRMIEVDFEKSNVFFIGLEESGSCPYTEESIEVDSKDEMLHVNVKMPDGECTSDATPRTFVIEGDKEMSDDINTVLITEGGTETSVPFKE